MSRHTSFIHRPCDFSNHRCPGMFASRREIEVVEPVSRGIFRSLGRLNLECVIADDVKYLDKVLDVDVTPHIVSFANVLRPTTFEKDPTKRDK